MKIDIGELSFKIIVIVIKMKTHENNNSMLFGQSWLKQARAKHDWEKNILFDIKME